MTFWFSMFIYHSYHYIIHCNNPFQYYIFYHNFTNFPCHLQKSWSLNSHLSTLLNLNQLNLEGIRYFICFSNKNSFSNTLSFLPRQGLLGKEVNDVMIAYKSCIKSEIYRKVKFLLIEKGIETKIWAYSRNKRNSNYEHFYCRVIGFFQSFFVGCVL